MALKKVAEQNTNVTKKVAGEEAITVKQGVPKDHVKKFNPQEETSTHKPRVGVSLGCTLNMDNYESMRVDCWLSDDVQEGETTEEAFARVLAIVDKQVEEVVASYRE